jgi:glyoxylase-like metal-dependent hydrolase (beta-lactamase superfamily II)
MASPPAPGAPEDAAPPPALETLAPGLRRLIAPNPSPMTLWGTNTYLLGTRQVAVIDPGPDDPAHVAAILAALPAGAEISHILVTHAHRDHSPGARALARRCGAPVLAFGGATAGRSAVMQRLADAGLSGGGEGVDAAFAPDATLADGDALSGPDWDIVALHTPGHMGNHLSFAWGETLFCGDLVMGWASSLVSPPDGDLTDFMASCRRLAQGRWRVFHAGHGLPIADPAARLAWLIEHRMARETQIRTALGDAAATPAALAARIYTETPPALLPAATRNVFAHLIDLEGRSEVTATPHLAPDARFSLR